ncbi:hypothetical protein niasHT_007464 [Heterodera trifolii]|uniref:Bromodomain associated domain-containing protein n=1 Tax=Heterodera trifolii TaxID=157864 RepID=A0ABD2LP93_9BILA
MALPTNFVESGCQTSFNSLLPYQMYRRVLRHCAASICHSIGFDSAQKGSLEALSFLFHQCATLWHSFRRLMVVKVLLSVFSKTSNRTHSHCCPNLRQKCRPFSAFLTLVPTTNYERIRRLDAQNKRDWEESLVRYAITQFPSVCVFSELDARLMLEAKDAPMSVNAN